MLKMVRHYSSQADILKLSEEEWYWMTGTHDFALALDALKAFPAQLKVVTCGAQGAMVLWQNNVIHFNGYTVDSVHTTGGCFCRRFIGLDCRQPDAGVC